MNMEKFENRKDEQLDDYFAFLLYQKYDSDKIDFVFGQENRVLASMDIINSLFRGYVGDDLEDEDFELGDEERLKALLSLIKGSKVLNTAKVVSSYGGHMMKLFDSNTKWSEALNQIIIALNNKNICFNNDDDAMFANLFLEIWPCYLKLEGSPKWLEDIFYSIFKEVNKIPNLNNIGKDFIDNSCEDDVKIHLLINTKIYDELKNIQSELMTTKSGYGINLGQIYCYESFCKAIERLKGN